MNGLRWNEQRSELGKLGGVPLRRVFEKRKFPMLAIRGYCGPRNLGCCWEWPGNGGAKGICGPWGLLVGYWVGASTRRIISIDFFIQAPQTIGLFAVGVPVLWAQCDLGTKDERQKHRCCWLWVWQSMLPHAWHLLITYYVPATYTIYF